MKAGNVEDIYELTPLQQGLLFHSLYAPSDGVYSEHLHVLLEGELDEDAFWRSWQAVIDRHPALRSTFHWDRVSKPVQAVQRAATLVREMFDLRGLSDEAQRDRITAFHDDERRRGFDLELAPLLRIALFRLADDRYHMGWRMSHLVMDGWSVGLLVSDFMAGYRAYHRGEVHLVRPAPPYRDYVAWWKRQDRSAHEDFWRERLAGYAPTPLNLGAPESPPAPGELTHYRVDLALDELAGRMRTFVREHRLTLHTVVQAGWALVLGRCMGAHDVVVGATMAHRPVDLPSAEQVVGPMIVTLPIRTRLPGAEPTLKWLHEVHESIVVAGEHSAAPLTDIRQWSGVRATELFESIVSFENVPLPDVVLAREGIRVVDYYPDGRPQYPLAMVVLPGDHMPLRLVYDRRRFGQWTAEQMLLRLRRALESIIDGPDRLVSEIDVLSEADRELTVGRFQGPAAQTPPDSVPDRIARWVRRRPDAVAVSGPDGEVRYRELDDWSNQVAHRLRALGVRRGDLVGVCLDRSTRAVVGMLGVLKIGAAYVPLDPEHPTERLAHTLLDAGVSALIADAAGAKRCAVDVPTLLLDEEWSAIRGEPVEPVPEPSGANDLAYVIYTSGSTGKPKGALLTHANLIHLFDSVDTQVALGPDDTWSCLHSYAFDGSVWEIWNPLTRGARLAMVPRSVLRAPDELRVLLARERVTVMLQAPSAFRQLTAADAAAGDDCPPLALRHVFVGGERVDVAALRPWFDRHGDQTPKVFNAYGPTEATVLVTLHRITAAAAAADNPPSIIGQPLGDTALYVLDQDRQPVPVGVPGELYIAGPALARGYLARPELTAQRFLPDPFRPSTPGGERNPAHRMYRTGDLVRLLPSRDLQYLDRADTQVKIRGYRIELGEIESALRDQDGVRDAVVVARDDAPGGAYLVAYVVPMDTAVPDPDAVRAGLRQRLPEYMVPIAYVSLDAIPVTVNSKVDVAALPAPVRRAAAPLESGREPTTGTEAELAAMFAELLRVERVGVDDNLIELGLHSLLATTVLTRIRQTWKVSVPLRVLFEDPTVAAVAAAVELGGGGSALLDRRPGTVDLSAEVVLPASITVEQRRGWVAQPRRVLLTGATGFLGAHLLAQLLQATEAEVLCLVRADDPATAAVRLREQLTSLGLWRAEYAARVVAEQGSLAAPCLGLDERRFEEVGATVDEIYHCGAEVNFFFPYRRLKAANVGGTVEVLRLAADGGVPVHYVSTAAVHPWRSADEAEPVREAPLGPETPELNSGYAQSKWVAERIVCLAAERGLPVTVYRPGRITGASDLAVWRPGDAATEMVRACAELGLAPRMGRSLDMVPVDYVAKAIVSLARTVKPRGQVYHLTHPQAVAPTVLMGGFARAGYQVAETEPADWYASLVRHARQDQERDWTVPLTLLGQWLHGLRDGRWEPVLDTTATRTALAGIVTCPPTDEALIARYLTHLAGVGFLPAPHQPPVSP